MSARCEEVIIVIEPRGKGTNECVYRSITVVYKKDGTKIAEYDSEAPEYDLKTGSFIKK